jgi:hypothetical protein
MLDELDAKVTAYRELAEKIEELEALKKEISQEILRLMPENEHTVHLSRFQVRRIVRLSIKTSVEIAKTFGATKMKEIIDSDKIKKLLASGCHIPDVSEIRFIQVSKKANE